MASIQIDTSLLSYPMFLIPGQTAFLDGSTSPVVPLPPGTYNFQQYSGYYADFTFRVTPSGTVEYDSAFNGFLSGFGGTTLKVHGFPIRLDATALSHGLLPMIAGARTFLMPDRVHELTLVPAVHYDFHPGSGLVSNFEFAVDLRGNVVVPAAYAGFARGSGNALTIIGYTIRIDGRSLSHDLYPMIPRLINSFLPRTSVHELTLIPAAGYGFQPGSGIVGDFSITLGTDGRLDYPTSCDGFLHGRGTTTLVVDGYPVLVDARHADSDLLAIYNIGLRAEMPRYLFAVLVPCSGYQLQTANGLFGHYFGVERDGSISFDPSLAGRFVLSTLPRLEVHGATPI